ncbi:MAG: MFS transporter [Patescibacteria group bacterium]|nr:MFS transporter [Patescibacteria group bacterium]
MTSKHPFRLLYFVGFIFSIQYGLVLYINSSFLEQVIPEKIVGLVFTLASFLSILFLLEIPRILSRLGNYKTAIILVLCSSISLFSLSIAHSALSTVIAFLFYTVANYSLLLSLDVFIEEYITSGKIGRTRGTFLGIRNLGILISPSIAVLIVTKASFFGVYLSASLFTLTSLLFIFPHLKNFEDPIYRRILVRETLKKVKQDISLKRIYLSEFLLCFFYSWMIIYMPIYLHQYIGFGWQNIGFIFTIMLIPFVLVDYPLGRLSDKIGEKKLLIFGFSMVSLSTIAIFFLKTQSIFIWALVLFATRVGAAVIEVMNESYFFKKIMAEDAGLISFFRNMFPFAFIVAPLFAIPVLFLVPSFKFLFLTLGTIMLLGFLSSLRLKDVK